MPKSAPVPLMLTENEQHQLQQLVNRHRTPQQHALRASIILCANQGRNHREIACELNISRDMARLWRNRWLSSSEQDLSVEDRLQDAERCGAPTRFRLEQVLH